MEHKSLQRAVHTPSSRPGSVPTIVTAFGVNADGDDCTLYTGDEAGYLKCWDAKPLVDALHLTAVDYVEAQGFAYNPRQAMFWDAPLDSCRGEKVFKLRTAMQTQKVRGESCGSFTRGGAGNRAVSRTRCRARRTKLVDALAR